MSAYTTLHIIWKRCLGKIIFRITKGRIGLATDINYEKKNKSHMYICLFFFVFIIVRIKFLSGNSTGYVGNSLSPG